VKSMRIKKLFDWYGSGGGGEQFPACEEGEYDLNAQDVINATETLGSTTLDSTRKGQINTLVLSLKAGTDNWSKHFGIQCYAGPNDAGSLFNWVNRWEFFPTKNGTISHTANKGYTGNGTTGFINTKFKDTLSSFPTQNSTVVYVWNLTNSAETASIFGISNGGAPQTLLQPKRADTSKAAADLNSASPANQTTASITNPQGLWALRRTVSGSFEIWHNGVLVETITATSSANTGLEYFVGAQNTSGSAGGFSARQFALFGIGSGNIDIPELYTSWNTYLTAIGALA
jgi:hypothetical protein